MDKKGKVPVLLGGLLVLIIVASMVTGMILWQGYSKITHPVTPDMDEGPDSPEVPGDGDDCLAIGDCYNNDPDPVEAGAFESAFYKLYIDTYLQPDGAVISNHKPVSWGGSCIGVGDEITSEAVARMMRVAVLIGDQGVFDKNVDFYYSTMKHPQTGFMMWKMDADRSSGSCGGVNSAVDSELIAIESLNIADDVWGGSDSKGRPYKDTARILSDSLKPGLINGDILPFCMYPQGDEARPCTQTSFLGYSNLPALRDMCAVDSDWCPVYAKMKQIQIDSVQDGGIYASYYVDTDSYRWENADIHPNWNMRHLAFDGGADTWGAVKPFYEETRSRFMQGASSGHYEICQEFQPGSGCKFTNPDTRVYSHWTEIASYRCSVTGSASDCDFRDELVKILVKKNKEDPEFPMIALDHYGNVAVLEAYAMARNSGATIGG